MTDVAQQLDLLEEQAITAARNPRRHLAYGKPRCTLCSQKLQTLPPRHWRTENLHIIPCPSCDRQLLQLMNELRKKEQAKADQ